MARCGKCDRVEEGSGGYGRNTWRYHVFTGNFRSVTRLTVILAEAAGGAEAAPLEPPPPPTTRSIPCVPLIGDCRYLPAGTGCESYRITALPF